MKIEAFLLCYNEIDILELVIRHYHKFCDKVTIYDNHSTDGSAELARAWNCEVIPFGTKFFDDQENQKVKNECWKGSTADWVICCDMDEVLTSKHPITFDNDLHAFKNKGNTILKTYGWQIMSNEMPKDDLLEITNGFHFANYSKNIIFNPKEITNINYNLGAHKCNPTGNVKWSDESLYVLHYKHIGGVQRTIDRYKMYQKRMSPFNRKHGHGFHYNRSPASLRQEWNERMAISKPLT